MRKDPTNITNEGLGLNPNINVEDEYIENLLKQVHFLGLEINLMYLFRILWKFHYLTKK